KLFLKRYCQRLGKPPMRLTENAMQGMQSYPWPGNIRELEHLIERLVATQSGSMIDVSNIPVDYFLISMESLTQTAAPLDSAMALGVERSYYRKATTLFEKNLISK